MGGHCQNCSAELLGRYCHACGQAAVATRVPIWAWLRQFVEEQFALSAKLPRTLWLLLRRPGFVTAEWRAGRHARYTPPLRVYLIALFVLLFVMFTSGTFRQAVLLVGSEVSRASLNAAETVVRDAVRSALTWALVLLVPCMAVLLKLLFLRQRIYLVEHLVFSLHLHTILLLGAALLWLLTPLGEVSVLLSIAMFAGFIVFSLRALRRAYGGSTGRLFLQQLGLFFGYAALLVGAFLLVRPRIVREIIAANHLLAREWEQTRASRRAFGAYTEAMKNLQRDGQPPTREQVFAVIESQIEASGQSKTHFDYHRAELHHALRDTFAVRN